MSIPNTTPTPNELFNGEMRKMTDSELRVVMIVTRATFGWVIDREKGIRKEEDWISHTQMIEKSGKSSRAISYAIKGCIENNWIEARTKEGKLLDTADKRKKHGKRIFYRLGKRFLGRTIAISAKVNHRKRRQITIANKDRKPSQLLRTTKETLTKETLTKRGLNKPTNGVFNGKRKSISYKREDYTKIIDEYQKLKKIKLQGNEFLPIQQVIKTMFMAGRTPEQIIATMRFISQQDYLDWTIRTVKMKLPEILPKLNFKKKKNISDEDKRLMGLT